jgi:acyl-coenzyme A thioesterase PaaI-like protein
VRPDLGSTTSVSINFLRKPEPKDLIAKAKLMKLGKRLAVAEVALFSPDMDEMVAHAVGTYSIPAKGGLRRRFRDCHRSGAASP